MRNLYDNQIFDITGSIVVYNNEREVLLKAVRSFLNTDLKVKLFICNNSPENNFMNLFSDDRIVYFKNKNNLGFGKAHNLCIERALLTNSKYHVILNPDIYFNSGTLEKLKDFMDQNPNTGISTPKVLYPNNELQYSCRLIPSPFDLLIRKSNLFKKRNYRNELRFTKYTRQMEVPFLLGCFLFVRMDNIRLVGLFDERYFLYMEDLDLTRRISQNSKCVFYPYAEIYHHYERASSSNLRMSFVHFISMLKYFSKWGWLFDSERNKINHRILEMLEHD